MSLTYLATLKNKVFKFENLNHLTYEDVAGSYNTFLETGDVSTEYKLMLLLYNNRNNQYLKKLYAEPIAYIVARMRNNANFDYGCEPENPLYRCLEFTTPCCDKEGYILKSYANLYVNYRAIRKEIDDAIFKRLKIDGTDLITLIYSFLLAPIDLKFVDGFTKT